MPTPLPRVVTLLLATRVLVVPSSCIFHSDAYMTSCIGGQGSRCDRPLPLMQPSYLQEGLFGLRPVSQANMQVIIASDI